MVVGLYRTYPPDLVAGTSPYGSYIQISRASVGLALVRLDGNTSTESATSTESVPSESRRTLPSHSPFGEVRYASTAAK